jgi:hypothetical protein
MGDSRRKDQKLNFIMIKPPFTILFLKNSQSPVTIRITSGGFFLFLAVAAVFVFLAVNGILSFFSQGGVGHISLTDYSSKSGNSKYVLVEEKNDKNLDTPGKVTPEIKDLSVKRSADGSIEVSFIFSNMGNDNEVFVWLLLNTDGVNEKEQSVYPSSPIFRGLPVDFRNGILHETAGGKPFRISFNGSQADLALKKLRILAYSLEGKIVVDKTVVSQAEERK